MLAWRKTAVTHHPTPRRPLPGIALAAAFTTALAILTLAAPAGRLGVGAQQDEPGLSVSAQLGGAALAVVVQGTTAYAGVGPRVVVLDVADPASPRLLGQSPPLPGLIRDVAIDGRHVYAAGGFYGLAVIDVSDPRVAAIVATLAPEGEPEISTAVAVAGRHAYLVSQQNDDVHMLRVFDVARPDAPVEVAQFPNVATATDIAVAADGIHAYVTTGSITAPGGTLIVYDVRDPAQVGLVDVLHVPQPLFGLALGGRHAFAAAGDHGLLAIDLTDPAHPAAAGAAEWTGESVAIALAGQTAYVGVRRYDDVGVDELRVVDVADPAAPRPVGRLGAAGSPRAVAAGAAGRAFVASEGGGIEVVDVSSPDAPRASGRWDVVDYHGRVAVERNLAVAADRISHHGGDRLAVVDLAAAGAPREVASIALQSADRPPRVLGVALARGFAFVATESADVGGNDALQVVNLRDLASPELAAVLLLPPGAAGDVAAIGDRVVIARQRLTVVDAADPRQPALRGTIANLPVEQVERMWLAGDSAYAVGMNGLATIDVRDANAPAVTGHTNQTFAARDLVVDAGRAYVAAAQFLIAVDVANPAQPIPERWLEVIDPVRWGSWNRQPRLAAVARTAGGIALTLSDAGELALASARDPLDLAILRRLDVGGSGGGLAPWGERAVAVSGSGGLSVLDLTAADPLPSATPSRIYLPYVAAPPATIAHARRLTRPRIGR